MGSTTAAKLHRHGARVHSHAHRGRHRHLPPAVRRSEPVVHDHSHDHSHDHAHSHALVDESIKRSREGLHAVVQSLLILGATALAQLIVYVLSGSVALLADLVHNFGDALTAVPLAIAFVLGSAVAERRAGLAVVAAIFGSACFAGVEAVRRLVHPTTPHHVAVIAIAGAIGFAGNWFAARIRTRAGRRLDSPALVADGAHARTDAYVSLAVVASAVAIASGWSAGDPIIGLAITAVIFLVTWEAWRTVRREHVVG